MNLSEVTTCATTDTHEIAKQIQVELSLLVNIEKALRIALDWKTEDRGIIRKLSTLRFVTRSFERHLTRLRVISEYGGYMHLVTDTKPHLASEVQALKETRNDLQAELERMIVALEHVFPNDTSEFKRICREYDRYLEALKSHGEQELELFHRSFLQEDGGSG